MVGLSLQQIGRSGLNSKQRKEPMKLAKNMIIKDSQTGKFVISLMRRWKDPENQTEDVWSAGVVTEKDVDIIFDPARSVVGFTAVNRHQEI